MAFGGDTISQLWGLVHEFVDSDISVANLIYKNNPYLSMVAREEFTGTSYPLPMSIAGSGGISPDFGVAFQNQTASVVIRALAPVLPLYALATVSGIAEAATSGKAGAFMEASTLEIGNSMEGIGNVLGQQVFGAGTGIFGSIGVSAITTTGIITLSDPSTGIQFYQNQVYTAINPSNGNLRAFIGIVNTTDPNIGQVQFSPAPLSPVATLAGSDWAVGDYLTLQGAAGGQVLTGLDGWFPQGITAFHPTNNRPGPSQTAVLNSLFNISRGNQSQALAGTWTNGSTIPAEQAINKGLTQGARFGAKCDQIWCSYDTFNYLQQAYISKAITVEVMTKYGFSVGGFEFQSVTGPVKVFADKSCTPRTAYLLQSDTMKLVSYMKVPHIALVNGGNTSLTLPGADAEQVRLRSYAQLVCRAPGKNTVVSLNV